MSTMNPQLDALLAKDAPPRTGTLNPENDRYLRAFIHQESGILLGEEKQYLLQSRLAPILKSYQINSFDELCVSLRSASNPELKRKVIEAITTHETQFFRDPSVYDLLRETILPEIVERRRFERKIRIWSAACSSGQEPYSIAILLDEMGCAGWDYQIVATDLSSQILDRARSARYLPIEVGRGMSKERLDHYFEELNQEWRLRENIRRIVSFQQVDLRQPMPWPEPFDLVLCRNVLIYFDAETRAQVFANIHRSLLPCGFLLLGSSEATVQIEAKFTRRTSGSCLFYQVPS